jgi:hypothetical protein
MFHEAIVGALPAAELEHLTQDARVEALNALLRQQRVALFKVPSKDKGGAGSERLLVRVAAAAEARRDLVD